MSEFSNLSKSELNEVLKNLSQFSRSQQKEILKIVGELSKRKDAAKCRASLLDFVMAVDPDYKIGVHHRELASVLEDMAYNRMHDGELLDRVTVNMAPRMGKSMLSSIYFPAWFIGNFPKKKMMMISNTADLAVDFGRKVRNLVDTELYAQIFPGVTLAADSKSAGRWNTNQGGEYFAVGVEGKLAGRGGDLIVIDDPHSEADILSGKTAEVFAKAFEWYQFGVRTRLMPEGRVAIIATRWDKKDLTGRVIDKGLKEPEADQWKVIEFPAILNEGTDKEKSLWPEQWTLKSLKKTKASMPPFQWEAQYMQNPTGAGAAIIKKDWWRKWEEKEPPLCTFIIQSLDTAAEKHNRADFSAMLTFGVFEWVDPEGDGTAANHIILLDGVKKRIEYPLLKKLALQKYEEYAADWFIVEKKNSGAALYQEMRSNGLPVQEFTPTRGTGDKIVRLNAISDIFSSGMVWYPAGRTWAEEVIDEVADFPGGVNDDYVDCVSLAIPKFRNGGFIRLPSDISWDDDDFQPRKAAYY